MPFSRVYSLEDAKIELQALKKEETLLRSLINRIQIRLLAASHRNDEGKDEVLSSSSSSSSDDAVSGSLEDKKHDEGLTYSF
jgi:hypothetical protein